MMGFTQLRSNVMTLRPFTYMTHEITLEKGIYETCINGDNKTNVPIL